MIFNYKDTIAQRLYFLITIQIVNICVISIENYFKLFTMSMIHQAYDYMFLCMHIYKLNSKINAIIGNFNIYVFKKITYRIRLLSLLYLIFSLISLKIWWFVFPSLLTILIFYVYFWKEIHIIFKIIENKVIIKLMITYLSLITLPIFFQIIWYYIEYLFDLSYDVSFYEIIERRYIITFSFYDVSFDYFIEQRYIMTFLWDNWTLFCFMIQ